MFTDWIVANELDDPDVSDGEYSFENIDLAPYPMARTLTVDQYPAELAGESVNRWAADYIEFSGFGESLDISFDGDDQALFVLSLIRWMDSRKGSP